MKNKKTMRFSMLLLLGALLLFNPIYSKNDAKKDPELPVCFIENKGQVKDLSNKRVKEVLFTSQIGTTGMFFQKNKVSYIQYNSCIKPDPNLPLSHRVDVEFLNSDPNAKIVVSDPSGSSYNFYGPTTKGNESSGLAGYKRLAYLNLYPNIDIIYTVRDKQMKYDIIIKPGGNIKDIKFKISGADDIISTDKKMTIVTSLGKITDEIPLSYYDDENKTKVDVKLYQNKNLITFKADAIHRQKTLVIDPSLAFFDFFGPSTSGSESVGNANNISWGYGTTIVGYSNDVSFAGVGRNIATSPGTPQKIAFISFFNLNGTHVWSSSVECNNGNTIFNDVMVIGNSYIVACGQVDDYGLPNAANTLWGGWDGFAASFLANGTLGQTYYLGGTGDDVATCITNGLTFPDRYIIGGYSDSPHFFYYPNSYEDWPSHTNTCGYANKDGFLFNFRITGSTIFVPVKYTFVGSCYDDEVTDVDYKNNYVASAGAKLYVTGTSNSDASGFTPTVTSTITSNSSAGDLDVFVLNLNTPNGSSGPWNFAANRCTFLGDDNGDETTPRIDVTFEPTGASCTNSDVYVSFVTNSSGLNGLTSYSSYQSNIGSPKDNFFVSLDYLLSTVNYASYFNSAVANPLTGNDLPLSVKADWLGNKYLCSITDQSTFPYTDLITKYSGYPGTPAGNNTDIFLARLNPDYSLAYQALTGTNDVDYATEIDVPQMYYGTQDFCNNPVFITGACYIDPAASNAVQAVNCRVDDQYILSITPAVVAPSILTLLNSCYLSNMWTSYTTQWYHNNKPVKNPNGDLFSFPANDPGSYYVTISTSNCTMRSQEVNLVTVAPRVTGITESEPISANEIKVYPNPSNSSFLISLGNISNATKVIISDLLGRIVYSQSVEGTQSQNINCSEWNNGIYTIKIYNDNKIIKTTKLSKVD